MKKKKFTIRLACTLLFFAPALSSAAVLEGVVIGNEPLRDVRVFLDFNTDGQQSTGEPSVLTDATGYFKITTTKTITGQILMAKSTSKTTGVLTGVKPLSPINLRAPALAPSVISPLSTLLALREVGTIESINNADIILQKELGFTNSLLSNYFLQDEGGRMATFVSLLLRTNDNNYRIAKETGATGYQLGIASEWAFARSEASLKRIRALVDDTRLTPTQRIRITNQYPLTFERSTFPHRLATASTPTQVRSRRTSSYESIASRQSGTDCTTVRSLANRASRALLQGCTMALNVDYGATSSDAVCGGISYLPGLIHAGWDISTRNRDIQSEETCKSVTGIATGSMTLTSPVSGVVVRRDPDGTGYGQLSIRTIIKTPDGSDKAVVLNFQHLKSVSVSSGDTVDIGTILGVTGATGTSSPHLHLEIMHKPCGSLNSGWGSFPRDCSGLKVSTIESADGWTHMDPYVFFSSILDEQPSVPKFNIQTTGVVARINFAGASGKILSIVNGSINIVQIDAAGRVVGPTPLQFVNYNSNRANIQNMDMSASSFEVLPSGEFLFTGGLYVDSYGAVLKQRSGAANDIDIPWKSVIEQCDSSYRTACTLNPFTIRGNGASVVTKVGNYGAAFQLGANRFYTISLNPGSAHQLNGPFSVGLDSFTTILEKRRLGDCGGSFYQSPGPDSPCSTNSDKDKYFSYDSIKKAFKFQNDLIAVWVDRSKGVRNCSSDFQRCALEIQEDRSIIKIFAPEKCTAESCISIVDRFIDTDSSFSNKTINDITSSADGGMIAVSGNDSSGISTTVLYRYADGTISATPTYLMPNTDFFVSKMAVNQDGSKIVVLGKATPAMLQFELRVYEKKGEKFVMRKLSKIPSGIPYFGPDDALIIANDNGGISNYGKSF